MIQQCGNNYDLNIRIAVGNGLGEIKRKKSPDRYSTDVKPIEEVLNVVFHHVVNPFRILKLDYSLCHCL